MALEAPENAFVARAAAIAGIRSALDHDPEQTPRLPAVTLSFVGGEQEDRYTGPATQNVWVWLLRLYVPLRSKQGSDFRVAQNELKLYLPALFKLVRDDPSLGGTCDRATISDPLEEPDYDTDGKRVTKELILRIQTEET